MANFVFSSISKSEEAIRRTWEEFRSALATGEFLYNELDTAKTSAIFFKVFDDLFSHCHQFFDVSTESVLSFPTTLMRAVRLRRDDPKPTYSRFVPNKDYITNHNRFSPPGVEWLYLALGDSSVAENCALKECRAEKGELFGLCEFKLNEKYLGEKLVDLTIAKEVSYEELNEQLKNSADEVHTREVNSALKNIVCKGYTNPPDISDFRESIIKWMAYTYARLLSKQIFVPVETDDKKLIYSPFQCMAQYFLTLGYEGIVYSSTVFPEGKNVVLFDKEAASPIGEIKIINV